MNGWRSLVRGSVSSHWRTVAGAVAWALVLASLGMAGCRIEFMDPLRGHSYIVFDLSPRGDEIVFSAAGEGYWDIYRLDLRQMRVKRVTKSPEFEADPSYSPCGQRITFMSARAPGEPARVYTCSLDGSDRRQVTTGEGFYDSSPCFSPDGLQIAFARAFLRRPYSMGGFTWDNWDVHTLDLAKGTVRRLTQSVYSGIDAPRYSPDGRWVVYGANSVVYGADSSIHVTFDVWAIATNSDAAPIRLVAGKSSEPTYAPGGNGLVYVSDRRKDFAYELYVSKPDGTSPRQITSKGWYVQSPRVTPDGRRILFLADPTRSHGTLRFDLWQVNVDGTGLERIADSSLFDRPEQWRP